MAGEPLYSETTYSLMYLDIDVRDQDMVVCVNENGDEVTITFDKPEHAERFLMGYHILEEAGLMPGLKIELYGYTPNYLG